MTSITLFALLAVFLGLAIAWTLGKGGSSGAGAADVVGFALAGVLLGIGLCVGTGISHAICSGLTKVCMATTDTTVWSLAYPLVAIPAYWIAMAVGAASAKHRGGLPSNEKLR